MTNTTINPMMTASLVLLHADLTVSDDQFMIDLDIEDFDDIDDVRAGAIEVECDDLICCAATPIEHALAYTVNAIYRRYERP